MKQIKYENAQVFDNGSNCKVIEYPLGDSDINCGVAILSGRYPETGYCVNEECKELIYVISGYGTLHKNDGTSIEFKEKDVVLIDQGELYYWDAHCEVAMPCTPAWYPEQHKLIEEE